MASSSSLFLLLFMKIYVAAVPEASQDNFDCIKSPWCRDTEDYIRFPFRLKDRQPSTCGYPGFDVSCDSKNRTVLELPSHPIKLYVAGIYYYSQQIHVYNPDFSNGFPKKPSTFLEQLNLSGSPFQFTHGFSRLTVLDCYEEAGYNDIFPFDSNIHIADRPDLVHCTKMYDCIAPADPIDMSTFSLTWSVPSCKQCEEKLERCQLKENGTEHETECIFENILEERKGQSLKPSIIA
ncbi:Wall-associated receptor kinase, galacturonan-binding domain containing protein, partial [Trema orientale]